MFDGRDHLGRSCPDRRVFIDMRIAWSQHGLRPVKSRNWSVQNRANKKLRPIFGLVTAPRGSLPAPHEWTHIAGYDVDATRPRRTLLKPRPGRTRPGLSFSAGTKVKALGIVCFWHLADISRSLGTCALLEAKRTPGEAAGHVGDRLEPTKGNGRGSNEPKRS